MRKTTLEDELKGTNKRIDSLADTVNSLSSKFNEFKNKVYELLDKVMGELKAIREEQTVISGYKDQIEYHETRIGKLEEVLQA